LWICYVGNSTSDFLALLAEKIPLNPPRSSSSSNPQPCSQVKLRNVQDIQSTGIPYSHCYYAKLVVTVARTLSLKRHQTSPVNKQSPAPSFATLATAAMVC